MQLTPRERKTLIEDWNRTAADYPRDLCLHQLFEAEAKRAPDRVVLVFGDESLTYRLLDERASRLASHLRQLGAGPDILIGICLDRSADLIVAVLGVLKSGSAYVPIDPTYPADRVSFMLQDAEVRILITQKSLSSLLPTSAAHLVMIDKPIEASIGTAAAPACSPTHLAYVRYTSGSTGKPKGVQIEHRSIVNLIESMRRTPGLSASDVLLSVTTLSFDISELEIHLPLTSGAQLVLVPWEIITNGRALIDAVVKHGVTVMQATPATWRLMLEAGWQGTPGMKILCGGEALPVDLARQLVPRCAELWNMYGPTETTVWSTCCRITDPANTSIGRPIANTDVYILDDQQQPVPVGDTGELLIGGDGVARGYLNRSQLTAEKFIPHPFKPGERLYRTGDLARYRSDGQIDFLGRLDSQIKIQGFRIEPGEIEAALTSNSDVLQVVVIAREDSPGEKRLVAYYTAREGTAPGASDLRALVQGRVPPYMVPALIVQLQKIPLTPNGKIDRKALPKPPGQRPMLAQGYIAPGSAIEIQMVALWVELLGLDLVGIDDSFFELGGNSLLAVRMVAAWQSRTGVELPLVKVFQYPTVAALAAWLENRHTGRGLLAEQERRTALARTAAAGRKNQIPIAIIGMVGRFPGAADLNALWQNLRNGVESISVFSRQELGRGIDESYRYDTDYVPARGIIEGAELFDAEFFGIGALEASVMDPQQRVFLELAYAALENAGYDPDRCPGPVGVYAGIGDNFYYPVNLLGHPRLLARAGQLAVECGNQKDYIALRVSYTLNLTGPAISANTACSTSLMTVDLAVRGLASFECDMALAGGIDIRIPQKSGFLYQEGGTFSRDGHCRPFDADATGTMFCDGAGIVVLKRLEDAVAAGDTIYAVICGTAKNNNGARTASFLAPSVEGQAEVVAMALANAAVPIETIGYIEAHGTGTPVGDPIEIEALSKVFNARTARRQFCYLGSIKGNIGHPTNAAGIAGLIKAALALQREEIPATINLQKPNPKIDLTNSCFLLADKLIPFPRSQTPRRAAVSSFGFGGTNVHAVLEEPPLQKAGGPSRPIQLLTVSARTLSALTSSCTALAEHFSGTAETDFADAVSTLLRGRKQFPYRRFLVAADRTEAAGLLRQPNPIKGSSQQCIRRDPPIVFLFGGQGTQYINMGQSLYQDEPLFRAIVDQCCDLLRPHLNRDLREVLFPAYNDEEIAWESLRNTVFTQPAIFIVEYALAGWWRSLGIEPSMMVGHSIGEFVAATIAGVFELPDVLHVVAARGRLMQSLPHGSMLSVRAPAEDVECLLPTSLQLAAINSPSLCVVSGPTDQIAAVQGIYEARGWACRELLTSHAFHSAMMDSILPPLRQEFANITLRTPVRPLMSTVTGAPMTDEQALDPEYWTRQARMTVRFSDSARWLLEHGHDLFLECGPRATMSTLTRQQVPAGRSVATIPSLGESAETESELASVLTALGSLWLQGVTIDWDAFYAHEERRRIPLPTYPFERHRHWVEPVENRVVEAVVGEEMASECPPGVYSAPISVNPLSSPADQAMATGTTRKDRIEARLAAIIGPIMRHGATTIDPSATFFQLGFDSLALVQVASALRDELGVKIGFSQLMNQFPSIATLAGYLEQALPEEALADGSVGNTTAKAVEPFNQMAHKIRPQDSELRSIVEEQGRTIARLSRLMENAGITQLQSGDGNAGTRKPPTPAPRVLDGEASTIPLELPATVPQRGIFSSSQLSDRLSAAYNESIILRVEGMIDAARLTRAIQRLSERHDALRASFDETGRIMKLNPVCPVPVELLDLTGIDPSAQISRVEHLIAEESGRPFPLPAGPLFRAVAIMRSPSRADIVLTGHHVVCDGWSLDVLIHDFCSLYSAELGGSPAALPPVASYSEYVTMCDVRAGSEAFSAARRYYENRFAEGFPVLVLPTERERTSQRSFDSRREEVTIPAPVVRTLRSFAVQQGSSYFAIVLSAYALLLSRVSGQRHFVVALPTAEQPMLGQPNLVGHCVNMLPFEVYLKPGDTVGIFLAEVQRQLSHAYDSSVYTLTHILDRLRPVTPHVGIRPVSVGLTSLKKWRLADLPQQGFTIDFDINPKRFESFEFYLMVLEREDDLVLRCNFDTGLFARATVKQWMNDLARILSEVAVNPSVALDLLIGPPMPGAAVSPDVRFVLTEEGTYTETANEERSEGRPDAQNKSRITLESLLDIWKTVLGTAGIGPDDNFFDLGGHSLLALSLTSKIQRMFGLRFPLSALLKAPTPRQSHQFITNANRLADTHLLIPIVKGGSHSPVFLFHSHGGNVLEYYRLATLLGRDRAVYGIQCQGADGSPLAPASIEEMARAYLEEIRAVQPNGPYQLGGYCLGGVLAAEVALQLRAAGQETSLVFMINAATGAYTQQRLSSQPVLRRYLWRFIDRLGLERSNLVGKLLADKIRYLRTRSGRILDLVRVKAERLAKRCATAFGRKVQRHSLAYNLEELADDNDVAWLRYTPKPYNGRVLLFYALRQPGGVKPDPMLGWAEFLHGQVSVRGIAGFRQNLLDDPAVVDIAERINRELAES